MRTRTEQIAGDMPDEEVDHLPHIEALKASLEERDREHATAVRAMVEAGHDIADLRTKADAYRHRIEELEQAQADVAEGIVLGDEDAQKTWVDADQGILAARRFLRAHEIAMPRFEARVQPLSAVVGELAHQVNDLGEQLARARWKAKMEVAHVEATR